MAIEVSALKTHPPRPLMATIIACWEVLIVAMAVTAHIAVRVLHHMRPAAHHAQQSSSLTLPTSPLHAAGLALTYVLALAAAFALWEMRRVAFILLAARLIVEVLLFAGEMLRPITSAGAQPSGMRLAFIAIDVVALGTNAAITWYAWHITTQQPAVELNGPPALAAPELTTSQFYLAPDHKKTIHKP